MNYVELIPQENMLLISLQFISKTKDFSKFKKKQQLQLNEIYWNALLVVK